jgi:hypothetical protein
MTGRTLSGPIAAIIALVLIGGWGIPAPAPAKDFDKWWTPQNEALAAAPRHHTLLFENDEVRVLTVTIAPGVKEPFHAHRYPGAIYDEIRRTSSSTLPMGRRSIAASESRAARGGCPSGRRTRSKTSARLRCGSSELSSSTRDKVVFDGVKISPHPA